MNKETVVVNGVEWKWETAGEEGTALGKFLTRGCVVDGVPRLMYCCIDKETKQYSFSNLAMQQFSEGERRILESVLVVENAGLLNG